MPTVNLPVMMAQASQHYRAGLNGQVGSGATLIFHSNAQQDISDFIKTNL
jgi:hypothetical protein